MDHVPPSNSQLPLIVDRLSFRYNSRKEMAIEDINLQVKPGEVLLIAGASGCGKTTLARAINGLIPRSYKGEYKGQVLLYGKDVLDMTLVDVSQVVGTVLQDPERQIVASNVSSEIAFGPENLGLPREEIAQRVEEVVERLRIQHLLGRETFSLSGGEKQKVALAGVLAMRPSILLLDEPLASLDPASAYEALGIFRRLADEGTTILMIEHRVEDALQVEPGRLVYMEAGQIRYLGSAKDLSTEIDYHQVKLPAPWVIRRMKQTGESANSIPFVPRAVNEPAAEPPLVRFEDVHFAYGDGPEILHGVSLEIHRGDLIAILGPNGAGKSTLVKHAIGLLKPNQGRVLINGQDTRKMSVAQIARQIGYVFQSPTNMLFAPTVREELAFGPQNLGFSPDEIKENTARSLAALNLTGLEEYPPLGLSFGQQKRTTIASVMAMRSKVMVMDEPTAGQDYANYTRFMNTLCGATLAGGQSLLSEHFAATLFITHDVDLAVTYANRVILVNAGEIALDGTPEEALCNYDLLARCRVRPTSLLELNCRLLPQTGRFLPAEALSGLELADAG